MTDEVSNQPPAKRQLQFSLGQLLLTVTIACLILAVVLTNLQLANVGRQLESTQRELSALQPLPVEEVARQFEKRTTLGPITTKVRDVRYSPKADAYQVEFSWKNSKTGENWSTDLKLNADGFGRYAGAIRNSEFITPLGYPEFFYVVVESPSKFEE